MIDKLFKGDCRNALTREGLTIYHAPTQTVYRFNQEETEDLLKKEIDFDGIDYFPEIVHLGISTKCNLNCDYCYSEKGKGELNTEQWKKIIKNIADFGVFGVTIGGMEPLLRSDICVIGKYANELGLNPTITTNGRFLPSWSGAELKCFKAISVSWHKKARIFEDALEYLKECSIHSMINYIYDKRHENDLEYIKKCAHKYQADMVFLIYKPVIGDFENQIPADEILKVALETSKEGIRVGMDAPCIDECFACKRFCAIDSEGNFKPCSFISNNKKLNALELSFKEIWDKRDKNIKCPYTGLSNFDRKRNLKY